MDTLLDVSSRLFSDFQSKLKANISELLPNSVPALTSLIKHCKENNINTNNRISAHCDVRAWYENIDGYDALIMGDQNFTCLAIQVDASTIKVYQLNYFSNVKDMVPSLNDFKAIVAPYFREEALYWETMLDAVENDTVASASKLKDCSIKPLFKLTYAEAEYEDEYDDDGIYKNVVLRAGFDLITGIKDLNSFENQIAQLTFEL